MSKIREFEIADGAETTIKEKNSKNGVTSLNKKDEEKKKLMNQLEVDIIKTMTEHKDLDPLGSSAVLLKIALQIYHQTLGDKYAVEEVLFQALKNIDADWFDENKEDYLEEMMGDLYRGDKTIH